MPGSQDISKIAHWCYCLCFYEYRCMLLFHCPILLHILLANRKMYGLSLRGCSRLKHYVALPGRSKHTPNLLIYVLQCGAWFSLSSRECHVSETGSRSLSCSWLGKCSRTNHSSHKNQLISRYLNSLRSLISHWTIDVMLLMTIPDMVIYNFVMTIPERNITNSNQT